MKIDVKTLLKMFLVFFRIGAFTIGGGLAMLPLIQKEVVDNNKWVSEEEIVDIFAICQSVPGVIAINSAIFVGYKIAGFRGAFVSAMGVILPSFGIILVIAYLMLNVQHNVYVQKAFTGIRAGVTAMILLSCIKLGKSVLKDKLAIIICSIAFSAILFFDVHAAITIIAGAVVGFVFYGIRQVRRL